MAGRIEARLKELGIELPQASAPAANYVPFARSGNLLFMAGQICIWNGEIKHRGKLGRDLRKLEGEVKNLSQRMRRLDENSASADDIERLERLLTEQSQRLAEQSAHFGGLRETVAAIRESGDQRGRQLDRLYDFIVERGMRQ